MILEANNSMSNATILITNIAYINENNFVIKMWHDGFD